MFVNGRDVVQACLQLTTANHGKLDKATLDPQPNDTMHPGCRRVVQVHVTSSGIEVELSQYVKRELHSLHNYLLTSFASQDIADFSKHFAKVTLRLKLQSFA